MTRPDAKGSHSSPDARSGTPETGPSLRDQFRSFCLGGDYYGARRVGKILLTGGLGGSDMRFMARTIRQTAAEMALLRRSKIALLSSYSIEFIHDALNVSCFLCGIYPEVYQPGFNQFQQEVLDPGSGLYDFDPDFVVFSVLGETLLPDLYSPRNHEAVAVAPALEDIGKLLSVLRSKSSAPVLLQNLAPPVYPNFGVGDALRPDGQRTTIRDFNRQLVDIAGDVGGVYIVDYEALLYRHGAVEWHDERMRYYAQSPIDKRMYLPLSREYSKIIRVLNGGAKKCIVVDLDNTLWGGILGEDGADGIALGTTYPGNAFAAFQQSLLSLHNRGILLAIASKNNQADVERLFARHPHMVLSLDHFTAVQINWQPKSQSIRAIAETIGISLEHMVFVDDNPAECEQVSQALPMVEVINFPRQPERFGPSLFEDGFFDTLEQSTEDRRRSALYKQRAAAQSMRDEVGTIEDFYRGLDMEIEIRSVDQATIVRAAQLTQKTNQFNATTRRYTVPDLKERLGDGDWGIHVVIVRDKFGDNGIVGVMMTHRADDMLTIDTFLLSCRVIGRTVEVAMLAFLCGKAKQEGARYLRGSIIETARNSPCRAVFADAGFRRIEGAMPAQSDWMLDLANNSVTAPEWFRIIDNVTD